MRLGGGGGRQEEKDEEDEVVDNEARNVGRSEGRGGSKSRAFYTSHPRNQVSLVARAVWGH